MSKIFLSIAAMVGVGFLGSSVIAQSPEVTTGLALRPAIVEIVAEPGTTSSHTVFVENTSDQALPIQLDSQTLIPIDNVIDQSRRSEFDASSWIEVTNTDFLFEPGEVEEVSFDITVPEEANAGGHYAILALRPLVIEGLTTNSDGAIVIPEIGASIFITVPGDIAEQADIDSTNMISSRVTQDKPTDISFIVRNTGNVHILPAPRVTIEKDNEKVEIFALQPQLILPNTEKTYTVEWDANSDFGEHQVRAELTYGNQSIPLNTGNLSFTVWPDISEIVAFTALAVLALFLIVFRRNIPKAISVLRGRATTLKGSFKGYAGKQDIEDGDFSVDEIAKEIEAEPSILGLPEEEPIDFLAELEKDMLPKKPKKKDQSKVLSKTTLSSEHKTTHITQTSSSTIVRESHSKLVPQPKKKKSITVLDHYEELKKPKSSKTTSKKSSTKKKPVKKTAKTKPLKKTTQKATKTTKKPSLKTPAKQAKKTKVTPKSKTKVKKKVSTKKTSSKKSPKKTTVKAKKSTAKK